MKNKIKKVVIVLLTLIALGCAGYLAWFYLMADAVEESYEKARNETIIPPKENVPEDSPVIPVDFEKLRETNADVYAWIKIAGTTVDYPIVQHTEDEEFYLNHSWEGKTAPEGAIFTQTYNSTSFMDFNTVIYGHQMGEGVETMFHQLNKYLDSSFMDEYSEVVIYTPDHVRTYRIFAAVVYDDRHLVNCFDYSTDDGKQTFLDSIYQSKDMRNQYQENLEVTPEDRIISLSTCISGEANHRLLVEAVLIDEK